MAEKTGEEYLAELERSTDPADIKAAKAIRDAMEQKFTPTVLDKQPQPQDKPTGTPTEEKSKLPFSSKQPRHYGS